MKKEIAVGLKAVTDGEFRRSWWHLDFMWGLDGVEKSDNTKGYQFKNAKTRAETARLAGKIRFGNHPFLEHYRFLKEVSGDDVIARQSIPAPAQFLSEHQRPKNIEATKRFYPTTDELTEDIGKAYRPAIQALTRETTTRLSWIARIFPQLKPNSLTMTHIGNCRPLIIGPDRGLFNGHIWRPYNAAAL